MCKKLVGLVLLATTAGSVFACPYTFINDSDKPVILAEYISKAQFVEPNGGKVTVVAPMSSEHDHSSSPETDIDHGDLGTESHGWNGHAHIYVYKKVDGSDFKLEYKIKEAACGKDSKISYSLLEGMANGTENTGRFGIKKMTPEREEAKVKKLAYKELNK
ncbi:MAG: hypothetical protein WC707_04505 [Candidatus Babeliaceae bacterium]|jgi:hypothetical protein